MSWTDHTTNPRENAAAKKCRVIAYLCPSDGGSIGNCPGNNYRLNIGTHPSPIYSHLSPSGGLGAFAALKNFRPADFRDGLTTTVALSERTIGSGSQGHFDPARDYWFSGLMAFHSSPTADQLIPACQSGASGVAAADNYPYSGAFWFFSQFETTFYNHANTPNSSIPDCSIGDSINYSAVLDYQGLVTARSLHSQGVNCVYMDGHTTFMTNNIDLQVWRALSTRAGTELDSLPN